jgi:hypothetical protein
LFEHWLLAPQGEPLIFFWQMLLIQLYPLVVSQFVLALVASQLVAHFPDAHRYPVPQAWVEAVQVAVVLQLVYLECVSGQVVGVQVVCCSQ